MRISNIGPKHFVIGFFVFGFGIWLWQYAIPKNSNVAHTVAVKVPELSPVAASGKGAFDAYCAACHGANASGTDKGPPLVHDIYNPGHHADEAFFFAAKYGVRGHHWRYGDMPAQPQVTQDDMAAVVRYVRELQAANGIGYRPHRM